MSNNHLQQPAPKVAHHRVQELLSPSSSPETKAHIARWYGEMIIELFLSDAAKSRVGSQTFKKFPLENKIKEIKSDFGKDIIDTLWIIKDFGDKASHYNDEYRPSESEASEIVKKAINLFTLILIDHLKKEGLEKTYNRATIFSILFPSVREMVLYELVNFNDLSDNLNLELLHKYVLACVKNGGRNKIRRKLASLYKSKKINTSFYEYEIRSIDAIESGIVNNELPVAKIIGDCKRNFIDVMQKIEESELIENERLIKIIETLLDQVEPTDMGGYEGMKVYVV